jgi:hypothetical protein
MFICSCEKLEIVPNEDNHLNYDKDWSSVNMVHVNENSEGSW